MKWIAGSGPHSCWLGINEVRKRRLFARSVEVGDVVYDVGANVGSYTMLASVLVGDTGHVFAFEPSPANVDFLRLHIEINGLTNVTIVAAAVTDRVGEVRFHETAERVTSHISEEGGYLVPARTVDEFVAEGNRSPDCLKIDVEGAELSVLEGARQTIAEKRPLIFVATHGEETGASCQRFLSAMGYAVSHIPGHEDELMGRLERLPHQTS